MGENWWVSLMAQLLCSVQLIFQAHWALSEKSHVIRRAAYLLTALLPIAAWLLFRSPPIVFGVNLAIASVLAFLALRFHRLEADLLRSVQIDRTSLERALKTQTVLLPFGAVFASAAGSFDLPWLLLLPTFVLPFVSVVSVGAAYDSVDVASQYINDFRKKHTGSRESWTMELSKANNKIMAQEASSERQSQKMEALRAKLADYEGRAEAARQKYDSLSKSFSDQIRKSERKQDAESLRATREIGRHWLMDSSEEKERYQAKILNYFKATHSNRAEVSMSKLCSDLNFSSLGPVLGAVDRLIQQGYLSSRETGTADEWTDRLHFRLTKEGVVRHPENKSHGPTFNMGGGNVTYVHQAQAGALVQQLNLSADAKTDELEQGLAALMGEIETLLKEVRSDEPAGRELAELSAQLSPEQATDVVQLKSTLEKVTLVSRIIGRAAAPVYTAVEFIQRILGGS